MNISKPMFCSGGSGPNLGIRIHLETFRIVVGEKSAGRPSPEGAQFKA